MPKIEKGEWDRPAASLEEWQRDHGPYTVFLTPIPPERPQASDVWRVALKFQTATVFVSTVSSLGRGKMTPAEAQEKADKVVRCYFRDHAV